MNKKETQDVIHWADKIADEILAISPNKKLYTCAAGISPSGVVHFGNFRDIITSVAVAEKLTERGKNVRVIFSWDDYDRFRKVPKGVPASFEHYIGMPLSAVPAPHEGADSYAQLFERQLEHAMEELGIKIEYLYQTHEYQSGRYDEEIVYALKHRTEIANILLSFMTDKAKEAKNIVDEEYRGAYYPITVYSRFTGKDATKVLDYDGDKTITYLCHETKQEDTIDITDDHRVKLSWKIDWPMRWKAEDVDFEPGGHDHASPGGSFDVGRVIAEKIFNIAPPYLQEYHFVGIQGQGTKMSGSKGNAISPSELLEIYTPELLKWIYFLKSPDQSFSLAFNSEIYKQYSEFDSYVARMKEDEHALNDREKSALVLSGVDLSSSLPPIPFRQAVAFGQIVQWHEEKVKELLAGMALAYDPASITQRLGRARAWLETYNPDEMIQLLDEKNVDYIETLDETTRAQVGKLREALTDTSLSIAALETLVYAIPKDDTLSIKENAPLQRAFFKDVYHLLIGRGTGPRLSTFLWAADRDKVIELLEV